MPGILRETSCSPPFRTLLERGARAVKILIITQVLNITNRSQ